MDDQSETATAPATQADAEPKATPETLSAIINLLEPLSSAQRQRTVAAAMMFLGEAPLQKPSRQQEASGGSASKGNDVGGEAEGDYPPQITKWMTQYDVSAEELDRAFHFNGDGTFNPLHAPGKSKKEQTVNTYVLTGLGKYLSANDRSFDDAMARGFCETIGCFDRPNHAGSIKKNKGGEFTGDKSKGYSLTNVGIKRGAALVKEVAGG